MTIGIVKMYNAFVWQKLCLLVISIPEYQNGTYKIYIFLMTKPIWRYDNYFIMLLWFFKVCSFLSFKLERFPNNNEKMCIYRPAYSVCPDQGHYSETYYKTHTIMIIYFHFLLSSRFIPRVLSGPAHLEIKSIGTTVDP